MVLEARVWSQDVGKASPARGSHRCFLKRVTARVMQHHPLRFSTWCPANSADKWQVNRRKGPHRREVKSQRRVRLEKLLHQRPKCIVEKWQDKGKGLAVGVVSCGKVNTWGKPVVDKGWLVRFVCADPSQCQLSVSSWHFQLIMILLLSLVLERGRETAFSQREGEKRAFPASAQHDTIFWVALSSK